MILYSIIKPIAKLLFNAIYSIEVEGIENVPDDGALICPNHYSWADPVMVAICLKSPVRFMAKAEAFKNPIFKFFLEKVGAYPVRRGEVDLTAVKTTLKYLKEGQLIGLFPQGTRIKGDDLGKAHSGVAVFAVKSNKKVIPTFISGSYKPFTKMKVVFGKPIDFSEYKKEKMTGEDYFELSQIVIEEIKALKEGVK